MTKFYSQHGEDVLLDEIFKDLKDGFFVEVGCIDGRRFSNTLTFEERGWKGLCVEAHSGYIELLKKNRPNSVICHCAVADKDIEEVTFFANSRGSLSTLNKAKELEFKEKFGIFFTGFEEQRINQRRLDTLLEENNITEIDILSLDIEGSEVEALKGLNLKKNKPKVLVIESDNLIHESQLDNILITNGYTKSVKIGGNILYLIDPKMEKKIKGKQFSIELVHTKHPLDSDGDSLKIIQLNTKCGFLVRFIEFVEKSFIYFITRRNQ